MSPAERHAVLELELAARLDAAQEQRTTGIGIDSLVQQRDLQRMSEQCGHTWRSEHEAEQVTGSLGEQAGPTFLRDAVSGVAEGACYAVAPAPAVAATDLHLATVDARLDGGAFASGMPVSLDGEHLLSVQATDRAGNQAASAVSFVVEQAPPRLYFSGPAEGAFVADDVSFSVSAATPRLVSLDAWVDGAPSPTAAMVSAEGLHVVTARATDCAGNSSDAALSFTIDKTPPVLEIEGVADATYYAAPVVPSWTARDANLASVTGTLNGLPFASGTVITADGEYLLEVIAWDKAGHSTRGTRAFVVDQTKPIVTLSGFADGSYVSTDVLPAFAVSDANLDRVEAWLDDLPFVEGTRVSSEGLHVFTVTAYDKAGGHETRSGSFTIDRTPPVVTLSGFVEGSCVRTDVHPSYRVSDDNPGTAEARLDDERFPDGGVVAAEGTHRYQAVAVDKAGNRAEPFGTFTIDKTAPVITVSGVSQGMLVNHDVSPVVTIDDANPGTSSIQLDGAAFASGTGVTAEGRHRLLVDATDRAGNAAATMSIEFEIDRTAPVITVSGVVEGGEYESGVVPVVEVTGATVTTVELDGVAFASGTAVTAEGARARVHPSGCRPRDLKRAPGRPVS